MGFYRIPIRHEKIGAIPVLMQSFGFPIVRIENQGNRMHYFCAAPKRLRKYWTFCIVHEKVSDPPFFICELSKLSKRIVDSLHGKGFFERNNPKRTPFDLASSRG